MTATPEASRAEALARTLSVLGIALGLAVRLALPFLLPFGEQVRFRLQGLNDEPAHFRYVEYVASQRALPVQTHRFEEPGAFQRADFEFHQPPLYYVLGAVLFLLAGPARALLACRLFSALCGVATLWLLWWVLASSPLPRRAKLPALMFAALWLTPAYFCALVSNDGLSWLLASIVVWMLWRRPNGRPSALRAAGLGMALGLGLLTKTTLAVFLPVAVLVGLWESLRQRDPAPLLECAGAAFLACLIASPWYVRNLSVYGSLWGFEWGGRAQPYMGERPSWAALLLGTNKYFWFPMQHVPMTWASRLLRIGGVVVLVTEVFAALTYFRRRGLERREGTLAIVLVLAAVAYGVRNLIWFAPEARFLLPAFVPIVYGLAAAAAALTPVKRPVLACCALLLLALLPFAYFGLV